MVRRKGDAYAKPKLISLLAGGSEVDSLNFNNLIDLIRKLTPSMEALEEAAKK